MVLMVLPSLLLWPYRSARPVADDHFFLSPRSHAGVRDAFAGPWPHPLGQAPAYRPVALLSYWLNGSLAGASPEGYRLVNYALHGTNAALLMIVALQLADLRAGFLAGLLFAVAPTTHESVIWISGRPVALATTFYLVFLVCGLLPVDGRRWARCAVAAAAFGAALLTYELAVTAPAVLALLAMASRRRQPDGASNAGEVVLVSLALTGVYLAIRWTLVDPGRDIALLTNEGVLEAPRRVVVNHAVLGLRFSGWNPFDRAPDVAGGARLAALLIILGLGGRSLRPREIGPLSCVLGAALVSYAPTAAYVAYTDRFAYLAAALLSLAVALLLDRVLSRRALVGWVATTALVASSGVALAGHGRDWHEAGEMSAAALDTVVGECPRPKAGAMLAFEGLPRRHRSAYVFITYFELALQARYDRSDLRILRDENACAQPEARSSAAHAAAWRWDPVALRLRACTPLDACEAPSGQVLTRTR